MDEQELRRAYLRVSDPLGTTARRVFLPLALAGIAAYALLGEGVSFPGLVAGGCAAAAVFYGGTSWWVRRHARLAAPSDLRERFLARARAAVGGWPWRLFRALVWLSLGGWGGWTLAAGRGGQVEAFIAIAGFAFGIQYGADVLFEVPVLRRMLADLDPPPPPAPTA